MHELLKSTNIEKGKNIVIQEIRIENGPCSELYVSSEKGRMKHLHSVHPTSRPDLYDKKRIENDTAIKKNSVIVEEQKYVHKPNGFKEKENIKYECVSIFMKADEDKEETQKKSDGKRNKLIGLQESERSLLDVVYLHHEQNNDDTDNFEDLDAAVPRVDSLDEYLQSSESNILQNILNELQNSNPDKWRLKNIDQLYPDLLTDGPTLQNETTVRELNIICVELRCATGRNWASSNMVKAEIVNIIVKAFGGDALVQTERKKKKCFNPESLNCFMCKLRETKSISKGTFVNTNRIIVPN